MIRTPLKKNCNYLGTSFRYSRSRDNGFTLEALLCWSGVGRCVGFGFSVIQDHLLQLFGFPGGSPRCFISLPAPLRNRDTRLKAWHRGADL